VHPTLGATAGAFVIWRLGFFHGNPIWPIQEPTQRCGQSIVFSLPSEDGASTTGFATSGRCPHGEGEFRNAF
jgi:hypothetical protein